MKYITFFDLEIHPDTKSILDIGALKARIPAVNPDGITFHSQKVSSFNEFSKDASFLCGHNIVNHDLKYSNDLIDIEGKGIIDTLLLSPLLFPVYPYHRLLKDDKLFYDERNNPLNDSKKAMELFLDEVAQFTSLPEEIKRIYYFLLKNTVGFDGFFQYLNIYYESEDVESLIRHCFYGQLCENSSLGEQIKSNPTELAYVLASINSDSKKSIASFWLKKKFPNVIGIYRDLRGVPCKKGCVYCNKQYDIHRYLKEKFGYEQFRTFEGETLQEDAINAALEDKSILTIFPTGGGKSITFQIPALVQADSVKGLTVVISPLQSLMKDQVDSLNGKGIADAVTINGLLNPLERKVAIESVKNGTASLLYIAPESLRSHTIENLLMSRNVVRFVIDEAHCFSSWGQDFRVDYQYIGDFIARLEQENGEKIPVSCFTATAKPKVVSDIRAYFKDKLGQNLSLYATHAERSNLRYQVEIIEDVNKKYERLRNLIDSHNCPTIVYVSRTKRCVKIAQRLEQDGIIAKPYHGKMDADEKNKNQEDFLGGRVQVIVATTAFGMGVDKPDVGLVVHYDVSDSLENYIQEAGRAGRDESIDADCYVLFHEDDLSAHFLLLSQTKITMNEIQQVWRAIKRLSKKRPRLVSSDLEIAREAGWQEGNDYSTRVKTAVNALEMAGYIKRENNSPRIHARRVLVDSVIEATEKMDASDLFQGSQHREIAKRIISHIMSVRSSNLPTNAAEDRIDYIADLLGIEKRQVIDCIANLCQVGVLGNDHNELTAITEKGRLNSQKIQKDLNNRLDLEEFLIQMLGKQGRQEYKALNEEAEAKGLHSSVAKLKEIVRFWITEKYVEKPKNETNRSVELIPVESEAHMMNRVDSRRRLCRYIDEYLKKEGQAIIKKRPGEDIVRIPFSILDIKNAHDAQLTLFDNSEASLKEIEEALYYLSFMKAYRMEGGFFMMYYPMVIKRVEMDPNIRYKNEDYKRFEEYYETKTQQIHIVGEYAHKMASNLNEALQYVRDYFSLDYNDFLKKYFSDRMQEINKNITIKRQEALFSNLTERQLEIINDDKSKTIVVAAGPGSGKTMILVRKLASLIQLENVKAEQLLMLTFSRMAAMEFKIRLQELIGQTAQYVEIKTFHSYAFDILGRVGSLQQSDEIIFQATKLLQENEVELSRITKSVLVIDEAQDISKEEYDFICAIRDLDQNKEMRIIAVGDDDQNIFSFRGSDSRYLGLFMNEEGSKKYELVDNFRSASRIIDCSNLFVETISERLKSTPINTMAEREGEVWFVLNNSHLERCIVETFINRKNGGYSNGSNAILTTTNEQAFIVHKLLKDYNYRAKLIQSLDSVSMYNVEEVRYFLGELGGGVVPTVRINEWNKAMERLREKFSHSNNLENVEYLLSMYQNSLQGNRIYYSDVEDYLRQLAFDDIYEAEDNEVIVSTIHKSKGHEFDNVYMLVSHNDYMGLSDEKRRAIYVGMTRAKNNLYVIQNNNFFRDLQKKFKEKGIHFFKDQTAYKDADEMILSLSLRDIWLEYKGGNMSGGFGYIQSGDSLDVVVNQENQRIVFLRKKGYRDERVAYSSRKFFQEFSRKQQDGYEIKSAEVKHVVYWKKKETGEEFRIVLPELIMRKRRI